MSAATGQGLDWEPLILCVAPNGARKTKEDHPKLPIGPAELAETAAAAKAAGAAMIHAHVRDAAGAHILDVGLYREAIAAIEGAVGRELIVQITTEAVGRYSAAEQRALVEELRPEAVSIALREIAPGPAEEDEAGRFLAGLIESGMLLQIILYSPEELARLQRLVARGAIPPGWEAGPRLSLLFVLGRYTTGQRSRPSDLLPFLSVGAGRHHWMACAFGPGEGAVAAVAAGLGGHCRIGFENNFHLADGSIAPDNAALVAQAARAAETLGRPLADATAARRLLAR